MRLKLAQRADDQQARADRLEAQYKDLMVALGEWFEIEPEDPPHVWNAGERKVRDAYAAALGGGGAGEAGNAT